MTTNSADPFVELYRPHRYKVFYGGRGSGKSWAVARALIAMADFGRVRILCCREVQNSIRDSSYQTLKDTAERMGLFDRFDFKESEIEHKRTGSRFIFSGLLRNENSIRSKEGIDICWIEEASSVSRKSWDVLIPTIRKPGSELWLTFNPLTVDDPTNDFLETPPPGAYVRKVNYTDNPYFPEVLREQMEWDKANDYEKYQHIWEGFPLTISGAQIFRGKYVVESIPDDLWQQADRLFFGADFGFARDPSTLVRCFILDNRLYIDYEAYGVGVEIDELPQLYRSVPESTKWPIKADCARPETISYLKRHGFNIEGAEKWPGSIEEGISFIRSFDKVVIDPRCVHTADEFRLYSYKTDRLTGEVLPVVLDKNNHCIAEGALIRTINGDVPIERIKVGDLVLTRMGFKRVLASAITGENREVLEITTGSEVLKCTAEHRIFTKNRGFVEAQNLTTQDVLLCLKQKPLFTTGSAGTDIRNQKGEATELISSDLLPAGQYGCTDTFGRKLTEQSRKARISITKMGTRLITICQTLSALRRRLIEKTIPLSVKLVKDSLSTSKASERKRKPGTLLRKDTNGTRRTLKHTTGGFLTYRRRSAPIVGKSLSLKHIAESSAQTRVNRRGGEIKDLITSKGFALNAERVLPATSTANIVFVLKAVRGVTKVCKKEKRVYDLTIEGQPEFFANGILVHNCIDGIRYSLADYIKARGYGFKISEDETPDLWL
nr:MAG TPA_asm: large terminase [Caudoviricetes sp.]